MHLTRRGLFTLIGAPMLLPTCAMSEKPADGSGDRFNVRPRRDGAATGAPTLEPLELALGLGRDGAFYVPRPLREDQHRPVVFYLHGAGGSGRRAIQWLVPHADRTGAIVVAPDSRAATWDIVTRNGPRDVAFIEKALETIFDRHAVDSRRITIAGFSDGASAALSWGLANGDLFSRIAAFSPGGVHVETAREKPEVFISHGRADDILPIVRCGRSIARRLRGAGYVVDYREFDGGHEIPDAIRSAGFDWLVR